MTTPSVRRCLAAIVAVLATAALSASTLRAAQESSDPLNHLGRPAGDAELSAPATRIKVQLPGAKDHVKVVRLADGSVGYIVQRLGPGRDRLLSPDEFTRFLFDSRERDGWL